MRTVLFFLLIALSTLLGFAEENATDNRQINADELLEALEPLKKKLAEIETRIMRERMIQKTVAGYDQRLKETLEAAFNKPPATTAPPRLKTGWPNWPRQTSGKMGQQPQITIAWQFSEPPIRHWRKECPRNYTGRTDSFCPISRLRATQSSPEPTSASSS